MSVWVVLAVVLGVMGLPLAALGHHFRRGIRGFNERALHASGTVVGHRHYTSGSSRGGSTSRRMTEAYVQFTTRAGETVQIQGLPMKATQPPQPLVGARVPLLYDPEDPEGEYSLRGPRGRAGIASAIVWAGQLLVLAALAALGMHFAVGAGLL